MTGSNYPAITAEELKKIKILIPPRPIQDHVAEIMEEAYKQRKKKLKEAEDLLAGVNDFVLNKLEIEIPKIEEKKTFVVTLKDLKEGKRQDVFYYQPKFKKLMEAVENSQYEVGELGDVIGNFIKGNLPKHEDKEGEAKILQIRNITLNGDFDLTDILTAKSSSVSGNTKLKKGELIFVITGATIGKVAVFDLDEEIYLGGDMVKTDVKNVNPLYLLSVLLSPVGQPQINQHVTGATNKHLSPGDIKSIKIPIPPIEIQNKIATEVRRRCRLAKRLRKEANELLEEAKKCVKWIILGGEEKTRKTIRLIADKLKESYNPQKIILYGSYAWGLPDEDSDIDLLIIKDTEEKPHDRIVNAARIISPLRRGYAVDIFVITPQELKSRLEIGDQFLQEIISRGEVLYG
jgi:restriction endonuclease S subunit/predicted nucleotidyltransferase